MQMKVFLCLLVPATVALELLANHTSMSAGEVTLPIVGVTSETTEYAHPYIAKLSYGSGWGHCGGSVIAKSWVLTAAQCIELAWEWWGLYVTIGEHSLNKNEKKEQVIQVEKVYFPSYFPSTSEDIALLQLRHPMHVGTNAQTVVLSAAEPKLSTPLTVIGWGQNKNGLYSDVPLEGQVKVQTCYYSAQNVLCAHGEEKEGVLTDSCSGDFGGPLVSQSNAATELVGIVSWTYCGVEGLPGEYTKVKEYRGWIDTTLRTWSKGIKEEAIWSTTTTVTAPAGKCNDINGANKDKLQNDCTFYAQNLVACNYEPYNTKKFNAMKMCCACGGGKQEFAFAHH